MSRLRAVAVYSAVTLSVAVLVLTVVYAVSPFTVYGWALDCCLGSHRQVDGVASPDGAIEATVTEVNRGVTAGLGYRVDVEERGLRIFNRRRRAADLYNALRSDSAYGVNVVWKDARTLSVQYWRAAQATVARTVSLPDGRSVSVVLDSGVVDPHARAGAMSR